MATPLTLQFEPSVGYQTEAIAGVVDLFEGLPLANSTFSVTAGATQLNLTELGVGNPEPADAAQFDAQVLTNLRAIQERNSIERSPALEGHHYSIEMETGTGKTYVYLRTMFELNRAYGFRKFVVVVPSIPIREGAVASIRAMRDHLTNLYNQPFDAELYDSKQLGRVRQFATASSIQILVLNIQAFQKDLDAGDDGEDESPTKRSAANVINRAQDRMAGRRPIEFIQATRPVVIVDEPQKMESEGAFAAIERLNPFCTLRYSATHKKSYNMVYRLGPVDAYDRGLVKQIEVASVVAEDNLNAAFVELLKVDAKGLRAQVRINHGSGSAGKQKSVWVKQGNDLAEMSARRQEYADGFIVQDISFRAGGETLEFSNGRSVALGQATEGFGDDVRKAQVRETVEQHLDKELSLRDQGIKVLSLFFIDKVANYRIYDADGTPSLGPIGQWFEEAYAALSAKPKYADLALPPVAAVHDGYFSIDKSTKKPKDTRGNTEADTSTYELIMRNKEQLLSLDEPLRFIFSHSALREGWDNPNVFQICTLNDSRSTDRKRQEIGRGLRLPVDQSGERKRDKHLNRLTIIANEAYDEFARSLQKEYEEDTGQQFGIVPANAFAKLPTAPAEPGAESTVLGADASEGLWGHLVSAGYLSVSGEVTDKFAPLNDDFELDVPADLAPLRERIVDVIESYVFATRIGNAKKRERINFKKQVTLDPEFEELWRRISQRTRYRVSLPTDKLVTKVVASIKEQPKIGTAKIQVRTVAIEQTLAGVRAGANLDAGTYYTERPANLPDILADLQNETDLTRATLVRILKESGRIADFTLNPQEFLRMVSTQINKALHSMMLDGISYEKLGNLHWEMRRLEEDAEKELSAYVSQLYKVQNTSKTPYDHVIFDSAVERQFAKDLDANTKVKYFLKLPSWFKVDTPIGSYNPDWAIVWEDDERVYLVRETKSTLIPEERRPDENAKIDCATKHFEAIGVDYQVVRNMDDLIESVK